jgi:hypothetical protein
MNYIDDTISNADWLRNYIESAKQWKRSLAAIKEARERIRNGTARYLVSD